MKKLNILLSVIALIFISNLSFGQTVLWTEDFEGVPNWTLSNSTGVNDADPNVWEINDAEGGVLPPGCGTGGNGNATLHVTCSGLLCGFLGTGALYNAGNTSNIRAQYNSAISTVGQTNLSLNFDWIGVGEVGDDFATLQYSIDGGVTWVDLQIYSGGAVCGGQGQWANSIIALPVACENQADLRFAFNWHNSNNNAGSDPSFAVNDMELTTPSASTSITSDFNADNMTICQGSTITFTDASTASGTTINSWAWNFDATSVGGVSPSTANTQGPHTVTYNTAGTFDVTLVVGDGTLSDTKTIQVTVNASANAGPNNTANVCTNGGSTTLDLNTLLSGADAGGTWTETSGTPSGQFTAGTGIFDGNGLTIGNTYTFDYTVTGTAPCPNDVATMTITIIDCSSGSVTADFNADNITICQGSTITFTDASTASGTTINSWNWTFNSGSPSSGGTQGPHTITYSSVGTFDVTLEVGDGTLSDTKTIQVTVNAVANAGPNNTSNVCTNGGSTTLDLNTLLSGADAGGTWTETSGTPSGQFTAGTGMFDGNGLTIGNTYTFDYTVTGTAPCPNDVATMTISIIDCSSGNVTANFNADNITICQGQTITFTDASTASGTTINSWNWTFNSGTPSTANTQGPHTITYSSAGTFDVTLVVGDGTLSDTKTTQVTVNAAPTVTATANPSTTLCTGDQVTLTGGGASTYVWDNGVTDGVAFPVNTPGSNTYNVTGTDANGCTNTASVTLTVSDCAPLIAGFSFQDDICVGDCITFTDTSSGNPVSWLWDFGSNATPSTSTDQDPGTVCFNTVGVQQVQLTITDAGGSSVSATNNLTVHDVPTVYAELDTVIDLGGNVDLIAVSPNFGNYQWTPDTYYIDCDTCATTFATPALDVDYIVIFTDPNGCTAQDTVHVIVNFIEGIGVPQAFSPNGDGHNDLLVVKGLGIDKMVFKIYNRYGELVFESHEQTFGWDGTYKGKDENPGVFTWVLEYHLLNGSAKVVSGNTTLIR